MTLFDNVAYIMSVDNEADDVEPSYIDFYDDVEEVLDDFIAAYEERKIKDD
ncbi:MAG: hypothetical protein GQ474_08035 [Sulfurimonas sp.]|nr:hypothetical protein [Sulfurimonas sp.]